jgi:hypothetical protein
MKPEKQTTLQRCTTAFEMWSRIQTEYDLVSAESEPLLWSQFYGYRFRAGKNNWWNKKNLWYENTCGVVHILRSGLRGGGGRVSDKLLQNTTGVGGSPGILYEVEKNFKNFQIKKKMFFLSWQRCRCLFLAKAPHEQSVMVFWNSFVSGLKLKNV